jgi:hypothetical protein
MLVVAWGIATFGAARAEGVEEGWCQRRSTVVGYFNGVKTTRDQALEALEHLKFRYGVRGDTGEFLVYELFYNTSRGFEDFVEVFEQRLNEHDQVLAGRFELFLEAWHGGGTKWDRLLKSAPKLGGILAGYLSWVDAKMTRMVTSVIAAAPSEVEQHAHRALIDRSLQEHKPMLLIGHSQGNLFANAAYAHAMKRTTSGAVQVVHIASASPVANGSHTLADLDLVINGLRLVGGVPPVTSSIPPYASRPPGENGRKDPLGHGLLEIYLNPALEVSSRIDRQVRSVLTNLVPGGAVYRPPLFSVSMTWDVPDAEYAPDPDLHVYEPGGRKVFQGSQSGNAGHLQPFSPKGLEHYTAECETDRVLLGRYVIAVANYRWAEETTVTVRVHSEDDGLLGSKTLNPGPASGEYANTTLFNLDVIAQEGTGRLAVRLVP